MMATSSKPKPHSHSYPQKDGTVGLAVVLTNCYEGSGFLPGTIHDHEKWVETLKQLKFDVRWERNLTKDLTLNFLKSVSEINVTANPDRDICQLLVFIFCGHGVEGYLGAQDLAKDKGKMSLADDVLPFFFGDETNFKNVPKLLFMNTCRDGQEVGNLALESSLAKVWKEGSGYYYAVSPCPHGFKTKCTPGGSLLTKFLTAEIVKDQSVDEAYVNVSTSLRKAAGEEKKPERTPLSKLETGSYGSINLTKLRPSKSGGSQAPKKAASSEGSDKIRKSSTAIVNGLDMDGHLLAGMTSEDLLSDSQREELSAKLARTEAKDKVNSYILHNVLMGWPAAKHDDMLSKFCKVLAAHSSPANKHLSAVLSA